MQSEIRNSLIHLQTTTIHPGRQAPGLNPPISDSRSLKFSNHAAVRFSPSDRSAWAHHPPCRAYKNLSPKTRIGVGVAIITWGVVGLYFSDRAEERFGYMPTEKDKEELRKYTPRIIEAPHRDQGR